MASYTPNLNLYKPDSTDDYEDFREEFNENMDKLDQGGGNQNIATDYDDTQTYAVGDYVIYNGLLYKCDTAVVTAETFDPTKWTHVVVTDEMGSGGGSGGHTIYDKNGTALTQENGLQFTGAVSVSDDSVNGRTVVDITGGGGNYYLNTIFSTEEKKIGYWKDGKPLYQRVFDLGSDVLISPTAFTNTSIDASQMQTLVDAWGIYSTGITKYSLMANINNNVIRLQTDRNGASANVRYVVLQYTKTADTADPNPQVGNVIYLPTIYSEEERQVGVWTDGKPLYEKVVKSTTTPTVNAWNTVALPPDISVKTYDAYYVRSTGAIDKFSMYRGDSNPSEMLVCSISNSTVYYRISSQYVANFSEFVIIIQYTKTTDVAGSGTWNGQGGLAHHYSTSEKVIGTWIDGKPLYEKTFIFTGTYSGDQGSVPINMSIADTIFPVEAWGINSGNAICPFPYVHSNANINGGFFISVDKNSIGLRLASGITFKKVVITLRYTKTTD